jgi:hypothetical protein
MRPRPVRVYQCRDDCCLVQVPSRRFWYVKTPSTTATWTSFEDAIRDAAEFARSIPQEVTA